MVSCFLYKVDSQIRMVVGFHIDDYQVVYYTIIMAVYFTDIIYTLLLSRIARDFRALIFPIPRLKSVILRSCGARVCRQ